MTSGTTSYRPGAAEDLDSGVDQQCQAGQACGQDLRTEARALIGDGLQGSSAEGADTLTAALEQATEQFKETGDTYRRNMQEHGATSTHTDMKYGGIISGG